jgi:hypothetical protein
MNTLTCPRCNRIINNVDHYDNGNCSICNLYYWWDDDYNYETEECVNPGFYFDNFDESS